MATRIIPAVPFLITDYTQAEEDIFAAELAGKRLGWAYIYNTTLTTPRIWNGTAFENTPVIPPALIPAEVFLLTGRTGSTNDAIISTTTAGILSGSSASGQNLTLKSTTHATKGKILFGNSTYDEVNNRLGLGTTSPVTTSHIDVSLSFADFTSNPMVSQILVSDSNQRLYIGSWYQSGVGQAAAVQASDFNGSTDTYNNLFLNPNGGYVGINTTTIPTAAHLTIGAGTSSIGQICLLSGVLRSSSIDGMMEFVFNDLYFTITSGAARKKIVLDDGVDLVSGRVPFATTNGRLIDDADMTFSGSTLTVTNYAGGSLLVSDGLRSSGATGNGLGYATGAGASVTQATNKSTGVTLNNLCGAITMNGAALAAAAEVAFTLTNSTIAATDVVVVSIKSGATVTAYTTNVGATAAGSCSIMLGNMSSGSLSEAVVINFAVIKAVIA